jgi:hypothetical protein
LEERFVNMRMNVKEAGGYELESEERREYEERRGKEKEGK